MRSALALFLALPCTVFAAGGDSSSPPAPSPTTTTCKNGQVWDDRTGACVDPDNASLSDDDRGRALRELAYAGRYHDARRVIASFDDPQNDLALTYAGFTARKTGDMQSAMQAYAQALAVNPDNLLARSYMGQGLAELGRMAEARAQLVQIRARGGVGSWAEAALDRAIATGVAENY